MNRSNGGSIYGNKTISLHFFFLSSKKSYISFLKLVFKHIFLSSFNGLKKKNLILDCANILRFMNRTDCNHTCASNVGYSVTSCCYMKTWASTTICAALLFQFAKVITLRCVSLLENHQRTIKSCLMLRFFYTCVPIGNPFSHHTATAASHINYIRAFRSSSYRQTNHSNPLLDLERCV